MTTEKGAQKFHTDDASLPRSGSASDWLNQISHAAWPIRSTTQIWVVTSHQYGISALFSQTSFRGETSGSVSKCRLFSQANNIPTINRPDWKSIKPLKYFELVEWNIAGTGFRSKSSWWISIHKLIDGKIFLFDMCCKLIKGTIKYGSWFRRRIWWCRIKLRLL